MEKSKGVIAIFGIQGSISSNGINMCANNLNENKGATSFPAQVFQKLVKRGFPESIFP